MYLLQNSGKSTSKKAERITNLIIIAIEYVVPSISNIKVSECWGLKTS